MKIPRAAVLVLSMVVFLSVAGRTAAQDKGNAGISMGYPASIGFVYHVSDRLALRPEISFIRTTSDRDSTFGDISTKGLTFEIGISGLFYVRRWDKVRAYVSPGYSYRHSDVSVDSPDLLDFDTSTFTGHRFSGSFGVQYSLHERFSVFGEAGLQYLTQQIESDLSLAESKMKTFGSRTAIGVIFFF